MIIEITDDGAGAWNLTARADKDAWPPLYMAYGRSPWAIRALVTGILSEFDEPPIADHQAQPDTRRTP